MKTTHKTGKSLNFAKSSTGVGKRGEMRSSLDCVLGADDPIPKKDVVAGHSIWGGVGGVFPIK